MKRNKQSVRNKTADVYGELDTFERKKKRQQKLSRGKKDFAAHWSEDYFDNIEYYESPNTLENYG
jgi:hypothetical protein